MDPFDITYLGSFGAGVLSFASPCVLPLIPAYLCFLGGASLEELTAEGGIDKKVQRQVFTSALAFVLGFATVFIALGATATTVSTMIADNMDILAKVAGVVIVIFGLHYMGLFKIGFLNFEKRFHLENKPAGLAGSYILGLAFAFGWTPCVGPILATILMVAASGDDVMYGTSLLAVYAAGIGLPFLLAAFAVKPFRAFLGQFPRHMRTVAMASGTLVVVTGVAIFTGSRSEVSVVWLETFPGFGEVG